jgi:hypothetical protein
MGTTDSEKLDKLSRSVDQLTAVVDKLVGVLENGFESKPGAIQSRKLEDVMIVDEFDGHKFTDDEKARLLDGKEIVFSDLVGAKTGRQYAALLYWDKLDGKIHVSHPFPKVFRSHVFDDAEQDRLLSGYTAVHYDLTDDIGGVYAAEISWNAENYKIGVKPMYPISFRGHKFSPAEVASLTSRQVIICEDLVGTKTGVLHSAVFRWDAATGEILMIDERVNA